MNKVDPDILAALETVAADADSQRLLKAKARHEKHSQQIFETQMELLSDEVERVVPRSHPLFELVLILAVARKLERKHKEPEFHSALEFPNGW